MTYSQEKDAEEYNRQGEPEPNNNYLGRFLMLCFLLVVIAKALFSCGG